MKYVGFWEFDPEALDAIVRKSRLSSEERERSPGKYPEILIGPFVIDGEDRGFTVYEAEDPGQLANVADHYAPEMRYEFKRIIETSEYVELHGVRAEWGFDARRPPRNRY